MYSTQLVDWHAVLQLHLSGAELVDTTATRNMYESEPLLRNNYESELVDNSESELADNSDFCLQCAMQCMTMPLRQVCCQPRVKI